MAQPGAGGKAFESRIGGRDTWVAASGLSLAMNSQISVNSSLPRRRVM